MPDIYPIFDVFDMEQKHLKEVKAAAGLSDDESLDTMGGDLSLIHPVYGEMLIGARETLGGGTRYPVMLLTTDRNLYNSARLALTSRG